MKNSYEIRGDITATKITNGGLLAEALIDTHNLHKVIDAVNWRAEDNGKGIQYIKSKMKTPDGKHINVSLHRCVVDVPKGKMVDHINHDTFNNLESNLRIVTNAQNQQNRGIQSNNKSGVKGLAWDKGGRR